MASLADYVMQDENGVNMYQWFDTGGGNKGFGIPGQQPIFEYLPATNEVYSYRGGQVPQEILAQFPGARVRDVTTDPEFEYGRTDDFMGKLGDYLPYLVAAGVGGGMIAPWAMGGAGAGAGLAPGTAGYGGVMDPAVGALEGAGATGGAAGGGSLAELAGGYGGAFDPAVAPGAFEGLGAAGALPGSSALGTTVVDSPVFGGAAAGGALGGAAVPAAAGSAGTGLTSLAAPKNILQNGGTVDDWLKTAGAVGPALLGAYASNEQANSLADLAAKYEGYGAPSRARYEGSFAPGFSMEADPGYKDALDQAAKSTLHGMSARFGNPAGSPNAWSQTLQDLYKGTAYPALQQFRNQNAATSGIGAFNAAAPQAQTGQLQAQGNIYNAIGAGIGNVFSPAPTLADIVRQFQSVKG